MFTKYNKFPVERFVFSLTEEFALEHSNAKDEPYSWGPPQMGNVYTEERIWKTKSGATLTLNIWAPTAPSTGGPMQQVAEWPVRIAGIEANIVETSMFGGVYKKVLVVFAALEQPTARFRLVAEGIELEQLKGILGRVGKRS